MTASSDDPFSLLGLPRTFRIDKAALQAAYLRRSAALHPDRVNDPLRQAEVATEAAKVNDARRILTDHEQRANALLALLGGPSKEQLNALPDGFLIEMMSVREEMEEALSASGSSETASRERFERWAAQRRAEHIERVGMLFDQQDSSPSSETLKSIRIELNAWRYIERMLEQLDPAHGPVT